MTRSATRIASSMMALLFAAGTVSASSPPTHGDSAARTPPVHAAVSDATVAPAALAAYAYRVEQHRYPDGRSARVHIVSVDLCRAGVSLRATSPDEGPSTVRSWARRVNAIAAINGDFFDLPGPRPLGPARGAGRDWPARPAFYYDAILAMRDGSPPTIFARPPDASWTDFVSSQEIIVVDGEPRLSPDVNHSRNRHPRSAVGFSRDGRTMFFVLVEGRTPHSAGATTRELGLIVRDLGAWRALRLDGGGSSTLYLARRGIVNVPADGHERVVANHLGVVVDASPSAHVPAWCTDGGMP